MVPALVLRAWLSLALVRLVAGSLVLDNDEQVEDPACVEVVPTQSRLDKEAEDLRNEFRLRTRLSKEEKDCAGTSVAAQKVDFAQKLQEAEEAGIAQGIAIGHAEALKYLAGGPPTVPPTVTTEAPVTSAAALASSTLATSTAPPASSTRRVQSTARNASQTTGNAPLSTTEAASGTDENASVSTTEVASGTDENASVSTTEAASGTDENASVSTTEVASETTQEPASTTALPPGWKSAVDPATNATYFYNEETEVVQWENPGDVMSGNAATAALHTGALQHANGAMASSKVGATMSEVPEDHMDHRRAAGSGENDAQFELLPLAVEPSLIEARKLE